MYEMKERDMHGEVTVPRSIFDRLNPDFFISHSDDHRKYMCANKREAEHLESLGISTESVVCDWYKITLDEYDRAEMGGQRGACPRCGGSMSHGRSLSLANLGSGDTCLSCGGLRRW